MLYEIFRDHALKAPNKTALVYGEIRFSYQQLMRQIDDMVVSLRTANVVPGSHVAMIMPTTEYYPIVLLALANIGATAIPLPLSLPQSNIKALFEELSITPASVNPRPLRSLINRRFYS